MGGSPPEGRCKRRAIGRRTLADRLGGRLSDASSWSGQRTVRPYQLPAGEPSKQESGAKSAGSYRQAVQP
eukprot:scaffold1328_cov394-Prasinococcus_capsulatus_cf.AAC.39